MSVYRPEDAQIRAPTLSIYAVKKNTYYVSPDYMTSEQQAEMIEFFDKREACMGRLRNRNREVSINLPGQESYKINPAG